MKCHNCGVESIGWHEGFRDGLNKKHQEDAEFEEMKAELQRLQKRFPEDQPWGTMAVIKKLSEAANILLKEYDYDRHGWEEIFHAIKAAEKITEGE